jgi:uncharacterized protein (DUF1499 family)
MLSNNIFSKIPSIHDITTDVNDPPEFTIAAQYRDSWQNSVKYAGVKISDLQQQAYPDIQPIISSLAPNVAIIRAKSIIIEFGWEVLLESPVLRQIEAVDITPVFRFRDDIVVRIRQSGKGSRIDMRSASRFGRSDLGTNARRIRKFIRRFNQEL